MDLFLQEDDKTNEDIDNNNCECNDNMSKKNELIRRLSTHKSICNKLYNTYEKKNHDYGNSVSDTFNKFGIDSFLVRMYDKINRVYTLTRCDTTSKVEDEKIEDTLIDLANYSILTLIELSEQKYKK